MNQLTTCLAAGALAAIAACVPEHDYAGVYDMNYVVTVEEGGQGGRWVFGGSAPVAIRESVGDAWLVDLGDSLCSLVTEYIRDGTFDPPYLWAPTQECGLELEGADYQATISGIGSVFDSYGEEVDFSLLLRGNFEAGDRRGIVTIDLEESW